MTKNKIITNDGYAQFIWGDGSGRIHETACDNVYAAFYEDTVSFVLIGLPKSSGLALFTTRAEDLELNGVTYSVAELPDAVAEAFAPGGVGIHFEIVDELPEVGESNVIYLVPSAESGETDYYTEYIWLETEERYEKIGTTDEAKLNVPIWKDNRYPGALRFNHSGNMATGVRSNAFGYETVASGVDSLVMGDRCSGTSNCNFVQGQYTLASAPHAVAMGHRTIASGQDSFVQGVYAKATNNIEFSVGKHNVSHKASNDWGDSGNTLFSIGNGATSGSAHNALEVMQNGDIYLSLDGQDVKLQDHLASEPSSAVTSGDTNAVQGGAVYTFVNDKLGSGFTVSSVTEVIESNERVVANALNYLNTNKLDVSAYTPTDLSNYYQKNETSGATEIATALAEKLAISDFNAYSGAVDTLINSKASQSDLDTLSGTVTAHTANTDIHITSAERTAWNDKINTSAIVTSITSSSTDSQVPSAKAVNDQMGGLKLMSISQAAYDALVTKDPNTLYVIND